MGLVDIDGDPILDPMRHTGISMGPFFQMLGMDPRKTYFLQPSISRKKSLISPAEMKLKQFRNGRPRGRSSPVIRLGLS